MRFLRDLSVGHKLLLALGATAGIALLVMVLTASIGSLFRLESQARQQLAALADVTGKNSQAALSFGDVKGGTETLATLLSNPLIATAALYDEEGRLFSALPVQPGESGPPDAIAEVQGEDGIGLGNLVSGRAILTRPITLLGENLGTVMLVADLRPLWRDWLAELGLMLIAAVVASASAFLLSLYMRRLISRPLTELSTAVEAVAADQDYSLRVAYSSGDEIGLLVQRFNDMLAQIENRDHEIKNLAFYDPLTHLPNRRLLLDRLHQALAGSSRNHHHGALMLLDLDDFKALNDTLGHDVGDLFLNIVARRLEGCIRECDTVARPGGDEFVVILEGLSEDSFAAIEAENIAVKMLRAITEPYQFDTSPEGVQLRRSYQCTVSIGITLFRGNGISGDELMKRADTAMYQAKASGRNTLRFFDPEMQSKVLARASLDNDLREAVRESQFVLYYQPQVCSHGKIHGAEALIRWCHPQRGLVAPNDFIFQAEAMGLIEPIGHWVVESACQRLVAWASDPALADMTIAVNVSARQFRYPDFVYQVLAILERTGANPHRLKLELTESLLLENIEGTIEKMIALKNEGVGFSLDDFGTGYSSLSYLKRLPLDQLKIDQSFVKDILVDPNDAVIARTVVALAHSMGLAVIAEGVETMAQRDFLIAQGCESFQGYLFGRPMPGEVFEAMIKQHPAGKAPKSDVASADSDAPAFASDLALAGKMPPLNPPVSVAFKSILARHLSRLDSRKR